METPSSSLSRRITTQAVAMAANSSISISSMKNEEEPEKGIMKSRSALIDITNDSPIVGLATGNLKTPSSKFSKTRNIILNNESKQATTPGSGEALLRGQVKTLLQKVEEEAVISKISFEPRNFMNSSPMYFLAPTPANTPQLSENNNNGSESLTVSPVVAETLNFSQQEENEETLGKNVITKLLFTDFLETFKGYDSSIDNEDDDDASVWSVQVNASTSDEHEDDQDFLMNYEDGREDELCEVVSQFCVNGGENFDGKHKIYEYDSDGKFEWEA